MYAYCLLKEKKDKEYVNFRKETFFKNSENSITYSVNNYSRNSKTYVDNKLLYV